MTPLNIPGIQNGYKVDDLIWRGAQPADNAWPLLADAGCKFVIDLNSDRDHDHPQHELALDARIKYVALHWNGILPPSRVGIDHAISLIDGFVSCGQAPIFVHCLHGSDRTGTLCACWRMHHDGWSFEQAMEEAFTSLGLQGMHEFWMAAAVAQYDHDHKR